MPSSRRPRVDHPPAPCRCTGKDFYITSHGDNSGATVDDWPMPLRPAAGDRRCSWSQRGGPGMSTRNVGLLLRTTSTCTNMVKHAENTQTGEQLEQTRKNNNNDAKMVEAIVSHLTAATHTGRQAASCRLIRALQNDPAVDGRFAHAVGITVRLIPRGLKGVLGVQGHLLGSVAKEYPDEHLLLYEAIKEISQASRTEASTLTSPDWLEVELGRAVREKWCMSRRCTTCGSFQMVELLTGRTVSGLDEYQLAIREMTWERAREVTNGLRHCSAQTTPEAIMWMLYRLWLRWGDRAHNELFPQLDGTFSGGILSRMRKHYAQVVVRQRQHALRQGVKTPRNKTL